jgi:hypothetical protein
MRPSRKGCSLNHAAASHGSRKPPSADAVESIQQPITTSAPGCDEHDVQQLGELAKRPR